MSVCCLSLLVQMSCTKSSEASHRHSPLSILRFCIKKTIQFCGCNVFHQILLQRWQIKSLTHHALSQISFIFRGCDRSRAPDYFHQLDLTSLVLSASATWLKKQWHFEKSLLLSESPEICFLFPCLLKNQMDFLFAAEEWREGARNEGRGGERGKRMDGFLSTITFISHLLLCQGGCLRALQNKLRVIFLWDADWGEGDNNDFSHVIKVVFTSACGSQRIVFFPQCDK